MFSHTYIYIICIYIHVRVWGISLSCPCPSSLIFPRLAPQTQHYHHDREGEKIERERERDGSWAIRRLHLHGRNLPRPEGTRRRCSLRSQIQRYRIPRPVVVVVVDYRSSLVRIVIDARHVLPELSLQTVMMRS